MSIHYGSYDCCGANSIYCFYESPFTTENKRTLGYIKDSSHFQSCILTESQMTSRWLVNNKNDKEGEKTWREVLKECGFIITHVFRNAGRGNILYHLVRVGSPEVKGIFSDTQSE